MTDVPIRIFPALPVTERGRSLVLGDDPKGQNFLYVHENSVFIRNISNPSQVDIYTQHSFKTTSAKYAPSGYYIASGDASGKIRIWDTINAEHILKYEYQPLGGAIKDIAWTEDSKRIAVCGEGREKFAHAFLWDSGSSVGDLSGQSKSCNSISCKQNRPYRLVIGSEDKTATFFEGPPFKYKKALPEHTNFVNSVRYSPDGNYFVTGGSDCQIFIYDGKSGDLIGSFGENEKGGKAHQGGVYSVCFSPDSSKLLSASGDKTAKVWNVATRELESTFQAGTAVTDMFLSCLWQGSNLLVVSLNGYIYYLDENNPSTCTKVIKGHIKPLTALATTEDRTYIYTGDSEGRVVCWNSTSGENEVLENVVPNKKIQDMTINGDTLISVAIDDTLRFKSLGQSQSVANEIKLDSQPQSVAAKGDLVAVACLNHIVLVRGGRQLVSEPVKFDPVSVDISSDGTMLAVGGGERDHTVHLYDVSGGGLKSIHNIDNSGAVMAVKFSPDGQFIATGGGDRSVRCYSMTDYKSVLEYPGHTAKILCLAWSPDSSRFATGGIDTNIAIWQPKSAMSASKNIKGAHPISQIVKMAWLDNNVLVSAGADSNVKQWNIE